MSMLRRFFPRPVLSGSTRLNLSRRAGRNQVIQNSGDGGVSENRKNQTYARLSCVFYWENCTLSEVSECIRDFSSKNSVPMFNLDAERRS